MHETVESPWSSRSSGAVLVRHRLAGSAAASAAQSPGIVALARALAIPLWARLRRGEGLLLLVGLALVGVADSRLATLAARGTLLTLLLASLYAFNDACDCERDANDPGKDRAFADFLARRRRGVLLALVLVQIALVVVESALSDAHCAVAVAAVVVVNALYSLWLKGLAGLDVLCVALWGGAYAAVPGTAPWSVLALVGAMTAVCHLFQVRRDVVADSHNSVRTISVASPRFAAVAMLACCAVLGVLVASLVTPALGATALVPLWLSSSRIPTQKAWLLAKLWFGAVFVVVLDRAVVVG